MCTCTVVLVCLDKTELETHQKTPIKTLLKENNKKRNTKHDKNQLKCYSTARCLYLRHINVYVHFFLSSFAVLTGRTKKPS